jgi:hypothetical protein
VAMIPRREAMLFMRRFLLEVKTLFSRPQGFHLRPA